MAPQSQTDAYVLGVGMTPFIKPRKQRMYPELGFEAGVKAMLDAQINYDDVDMGVACYCYGDSTCGQRVFYQFGQTSIPIWNVNNNCSTGSTGRGWRTAASPSPCPSPTPRPAHRSGSRPTQAKALWARCSVKNRTAHGNQWPSCLSHSVSQKGITRSMTKNCWPSCWHFLNGATT